MTPKTKRNARFLLLSSLFVVPVALILLFPGTAHAAGIDLNPLHWVGNAFTTAIKSLLYALLVLFSWIASIAFVLFNWVTDPKYFTLFFNLASVYELWKFIRDFLNLFFILVLLFTAFAIIFQIQKYNNKKIILSLALAALFVNFSFPISRILIDVANVPMYFFMSQMGSAGGGTALSSALSASQLRDALIPPASGAQGTEITQLLAAIAFMFLFAITLLILAVLFVIRLIALLILVIFSSVGFVAGLVPGMQKYSSDWWKNFMKHLLFGPAAMLMLLVATRFFVEISHTDLGAEAAATGVTTPALAKVFGSMAMFSVPIVMLWMSIGLAGQMAGAGGKEMSKWGYKVANWGKKQVTGGAKGVGRMAVSPITTRASAAGQGLKKGLSQGRLFGVNYGAKGVGKWVNPEARKEKKEELQAKYSGFVSGGKKGVQTEMEKLHNKKVGETEKQFEEGRKSDTELRGMVADPRKHDKAEVEAAVNLLKKRESFKDMDDLKKALDALDVTNEGNPLAQQAKKAELVRKADKSLFKNADDLIDAIYHLGNDTKSISQIIDKADSGALKMSAVQYDQLNKINPAVSGSLDAKLKKEGLTKVLIDYDISQGKSPNAAFADRLSALTAEEIGKMKDIHGDATRAAHPELVKFVKAQMSSGNWSKEEQIDAYKKLNSAQKEAWRKADIHPK